MKVMRTNDNGFTLVEIMIAMALGGIVMALIYTAFQSQQRSYLAQGQVEAMQQNVRAGLDIMTREIRMAGLNPPGEDSATITAADATSITFSMDLNGNKSIVPDATNPGENITYSLYTAADGVKSLGRKNPTTNQAVAEYIEQLEFYYTLSGGTTKTLTPTAAELEEIRTVQISILAKARKPDSNFLNTATYTSGSGDTWGSPYNDNYRRRLLTTTVQCRNMNMGL